MLRPFTLSNGQVIPSGTMIEVPAVAVNSDPEVFPGPLEFDPLRFYRLRQSAKAQGSVEGAALNQFVSVSQNSLTFGYGRHACPGRFFAANEIKMILANVLLEYDVRMPEGTTGRYPNIEFAHMVSDDTYIGQRMECCGITWLTCAVDPRLVQEAALPEDVYLGIVSVGGHMYSLIHVRPCMECNKCAQMASPALAGKPGLCINSCKFIHAN